MTDPITGLLSSMLTNNSYLATFETKLDWLSAIAKVDRDIILDDLRRIYREAWEHVSFFAFANKWFDDVRDEILKGSTYESIIYGE